MNRIFAYIFLGLFTCQMNALGEEVVEINSIRLGEVKVAGFSLLSNKTVKIDAEGAGEDRERTRVENMMADPHNMFAYAWIINAKSRELVWRMTVDNTKRNRSTRLNRIYKDEIRLPAGEYEVYFSAMVPTYSFKDDGFFSLGRLLSKLLRDDKWYEADEERWHISIANVDQAVTPVSVTKYHNALKQQAVVSITGLRDSDYRQEGFRLSKRGTFYIYAIGEAFEDEAYDYSWIVDASTSMKIWESLPEKSDYGGGAIKNRVWRETLTLEPGNYWVYSVMDDSHSPENWNANPPYDPYFYGITITGVEGRFDPKSVESMPKLKVQPIVELTRIGDDEFVYEGFKIDEPMQVRIYALGEGRDGRMFDYGWIENANTGEKVWQMDYNRTRHGGGAKKNRLIDEVITLPAGSYMVYYESDDSHSYEDWNASKPYQPQSWGITVFPADPKYNVEDIQKFDEIDYAQDIICQIVRVGDGQYIQKRFQLDEETYIRVYAIGEGDWDEMFDFGWIEDEYTGRILWEMDYGKTRWAGGARKNRLVDNVIKLPAGKYILRFKTDDSHSFEDWNADPPKDPLHYGITLYRRSEK
ncbi:MAG: hypothetical protein Kow0042_09650 [Calditrichia bacterium]